MMGGILSAFVYQYLFCPDPEMKLRASFKRPQNEDESVQLTVVPGGEYNKLSSSDTWDDVIQYAAICWKYNILDFTAPVPTELQMANFED